MQPGDICTVEGCEKRIRRGKWCDMHQSRWYRQGNFDDPKPTAAERFWLKVEKSSDPDGCWVWTAKKNWRGYGSFDNKQAHRWSYAAAHGPIPAGMQIDHLCRNTSCVRPDHLECVTPQENHRRSNAGVTRGEQQRAKTHCPYGHPYDDTNTGRTTKGRYCKICQRIRSRQQYLKKKAQRLGAAGVEPLCCETCGQPLPRELRRLLLAARLDEQAPI